MADRRDGGKRAAIKNIRHKISSTLSRFFKANAGGVDYVDCPKPQYNAFSVGYGRVRSFKGYDNDFFKISIRLA
jgi:hypothetical protein